MEYKFVRVNNLTTYYIDINFSPHSRSIYANQFGEYFFVYEDLPFKEKVNWELHWGGGAGEGREGQEREDRECQGGQYREGRGGEGREGQEREDRECQGGGAEEGRECQG